MTSGPESQCSRCVRFRSPFSGRAAAGVTGPSCDAFQQGIPRRVYGNGLDHRQPIDGDHGLRWESAGLPFPESAFLPQFPGVGGNPTA